MTGIPADLLGALAGQPGNGGPVAEQGAPPVPRTLDTIDTATAEILHAIATGCRLSQAADDARAVREAGQGVLAFAQAYVQLETMGAPKEAAAASGEPAPQQLPVTPHAVGLVRHALEESHGVPGHVFDQLLTGAQGHLDDLQGAGEPGAQPEAGPAPQATGGGA